MKYVLSSMTLMLGLNSFAAVAPYFDQINQIQAVLESNDLYNVLKGQMITNINVLERGEIKVSTKSCQVVVTLETHVPNHPGVTEYSVQSISEPACK